MKLFTVRRERCKYSLYVDCYIQVYVVMGFWVKFQVNEADFQLKLINPNTHVPLHSTQLRRPDEI